MQAGIRRGTNHYGDSWALIDNVALDIQNIHVNVIDNTDPSVTATGNAGTYGYSLPAGGSHITMTGAGATVTVPFTGSRAYWVGIKAPDTGLADVYLDDVKVATVDSYNPASLTRQLLYDTGPITARTPRPQDRRGQCAPSRSHKQQCRRTRHGLVRTKAHRVQSRRSVRAD